MMRPSFILALALVAGCAVEAPPAGFTTDTATAPDGGRERYRLDCAELPAPVDEPMVRGGYNEGAMLEVLAPIEGFYFDPDEPARAALIDLVRPEARDWLEAHNADGFPLPPDRWLESFTVDEEGRALGPCRFLAATLDEHTDEMVGWLSTVDLLVDEIE